MALAINRYAGFGEEVSFGEHKSPTFYIDIMSASVEADERAFLRYEGSRGRAYRLQRLGYYNLEGEIKYAFDVASVGWFLKWALGGYKWIPAGEQMEHYIWGNDSILKSFTVCIGKDKLSDIDFEHVLNGTVCRSLDLAVEEGYAECTMSLIAAKDKRGTLQTPPSVEDKMYTEPPLVFHEFKVKINDVDVSHLVRTLSVSINNNTNTDSGRALGAPWARRQFQPGAREITVSLTQYHDALDAIFKYWGATAGISINAPEEFVLAVDVLYDDQTINFYFPRASYRKVSTNPSARDELIQENTITCLAGEVMVGEETVITDCLVKITNNYTDYGEQF